MTAASDGGGPRISVTNNHIVNSDVGIRTSNVNLNADNNRFTNVRMPFDISGGEARVSGTIIDHTQSPGTNSSSSTTNSQAGWRRSKAPAMPVVCSHCKSIFPSANYTVFNAKFYAKNNREHCDFCNSEEAFLADGFYEFVNETVKLLAGPPESIEAFSNIQKLVDLMIKQEISAPDAIEQINKINPQLGGILSKILENHKKSVFTGIIFIFELLANYDSAKDQLYDFIDGGIDLYYEYNAAIHTNSTASKDVLMIP
jgi:hypothetical protein